MYYTKSQICRMTGVSATTLRHYNEYGIVSPRVNPENNYKMYTIADAVMIMDTFEKREAGISHSDIAEYHRILCGDESISGKVEDMIEKFEYQRRSIENKIRTLRTIKSYSDEYSLNRPFISKFPVLYMMTYDGTEKTSRILSKMQKQAPLAGIAMKVGERSDDNVIGFTIEGDMLSEFSDDELKHMTRFGRTRLLVDKMVPDINSITKDDFSEIYEYAQRHNYKPLSDLICVVYYVFQDNGKTGGYVEGGIVIDE